MQNKGQQQNNLSRTGVASVMKKQMWKNMNQREITDWDAEISRDEEIEYLEDESIETKEN